MGRSVSNGGIQMSINNNSKYLKKLLLFTFLIGCLPVIFLGVFSYFKSTDIVQNKVNETKLQVLQQNQMRVEEVLKSIEYYYMVMANSSTVNDYLDKKLNYINYDAVIDIHRRLIGIKAVQLSVKSASFVNFDNDWIISTEGISTLKEELNMKAFEEVIKDSRKSFWIYGKEGSNIFNKAY